MFNFKYGKQNCLQENTPNTVFEVFYKCDLPYSDIKPSKGILFIVAIDQENVIEKPHGKYKLEVMRCDTSTVEFKTDRKKTIWVIVNDNCSL